jgi:type I restriction enzyme S subunit
LGDIAKWGSGGTPTVGNPAFYGGDIPWAVIGDLTEGLVTRTKASITEAGLSKSAAKVVPEGAVLIAMYGASIGRLGITARPMATNQAIAHALTTDRLNPKFLFYYLLSQKRGFVAAGKGAAQPNIGQAILKAWPIEFPEDPAEQHRIVDILEDHLSRLDAAQAYLKSAIAKADAMQRGVLQSAIRGQVAPSGRPAHSREDQLSTRRALCPENMKRGRPDPSGRTQDFDGLPETWTQVSLEEATHPVRTISYGILKPGPNLGQGVPYVRVVNMRGDALGLDDLHRTSVEIAKQYERASLVPGDVLLSIRGTYGRVVQVPDALIGGNITQDTARLAFVGPIDPSFACVYLRSPYAQSYFKKVARGVAVKGVNIGDLRTMPFPIPPLTEQLQIVAKVDELSSELEDARLTAESGLRRATTLRHSLLAAAFAGRLECSRFFGQAN